MNKIFYRAKNGYTADIIPFYENGVFHLFYLHDFRNREFYGEGTPWYYISTKDFVHFEEYGEVIPRGSKNSQDLYIFTGSVLKELDNKYHVFYTGHNPHFKQKGKPEQAVMHAVSEDLKHWVKKPEDTFYAPLDIYEPHDWRDPYVFYNEESKKYWMLLAARTIEGPAIRKGCTALCTSKDLKKWNIEKPLWTPNYFYTHECPDLFKIGDWWYLIFSEFSDNCQTRYRRAKSLGGPWLAANDDVFDGRAYYAAKTASDGENRYMFGWNPTKSGNDNQPWDWGGNLVVHEIFQQNDGSLSTRMPKAIRNYFTHEIFSLEIINIKQEDGFSTYPLKVNLGSSYRISMKVSFSGDAAKTGVQLRHNIENDDSYAYIINNSKSKFNFSKIPNHPWNYANFANVERKVALQQNKFYDLDILVEDDVCVAYLDNSIALSSRMYKNNGYGASLFIADGSATFEKIKFYIGKE